MYCLTSLSELFRLYGGVIIATEGLQNEGRCSCLQSLGSICQTYLEMMFDWEINSMCY